MIGVGCPKGTNQTCPSCDNDRLILAGQLWCFPCGSNPIATNVECRSRVQRGICAAGTIATSRRVVGFRMPIDAKQTRRRQKFCPLGTLDNSPPFQRWVSETRQSTQVPQGTTQFIANWETNGDRSSNDESGVITKEPVRSEFFTLCIMPRISRIAPGGMLYHVLNRGVV